MVTARPLPRPAPTDTDQRILMHGMSWWQFETILAARGDNPVPRIAYQEGTIELMSPSHRHEEKKSLLGSLVEAYCFERRIRFFPWASTTLKNPSVERGAEPDASYRFEPGGEVPDLVIEAVLTSGGLDKLQLYRELGIRELWFWFEAGIEAYALQADAYAPIDESTMLPGLMIAELAEFARREEVYDAILAFRDALAARRG